MENLEAQNEGAIDVVYVSPARSGDADGLAAMEQDQAAQDAHDIADALTQDLPTDGPALDEAFRQEDAKEEQKAAARFNWHGKDILGNVYSGTRNTSAECYSAANLAGAVNCFPENNPDFVEPEVSIEPEAKPISAFEANDFYAQGYSDGDAAYQDVKTLILAWVSEQMLSSNLGAAQDVDNIPFVTYVRHNR